MKNKSLRKKISIFALSLSTIITLPYVLTSCSNVRQNLIDNTIFKDEKGDKFATDSILSMENIAKKSLRSSVGQDAFLNELVLEIALNWIKRTDLGTELSNELTEKKKGIAKEYKDLVKSYKDENKENWDIVFQQKVLDENGGTEQSWGKKILKEWALSKLEEKLFANDYSAVLGTDNAVIVEPSDSQIFDALKSSTTTQTPPTPTYKFGFGFDPNLVNSSYSKSLHTDLSNFQKFIYSKWLEIENPYVMNMVLWKYGTPENIGGVSNYYNIPKVVSSEGDKKSVREGEEGDKPEDNKPTVTTQVTGDYAHPYFNDKKNNDGSSTVQKYQSFLTAADKNPNFKLSTTGNDQIGLKNIDKNFTEDSSTKILVKNGSAYNDLYTEFAAASAHLYQRIPFTTNRGTLKATVNAINEKQITTSGTVANGLGVDPITDEFVQTTQFTSSNGGSSSQLIQTELDTPLVKELINPTGPLSSKSNGKLYAIDAFTPSNSKTTNGSQTTKILDEFMFLRNEAGVHAISIDGIQHIQKAKSEIEKKNKSGDIVFYYSLMKKAGFSNFDVDIKSELSTFFNNNKNFLILEFAKTADGQKMFFNKTSDGTQTNRQELYDFITSLVEYRFALSKVNRQKEFVQKMYDAKSKYSANYGVDAFKNGLASRWVYSLDTTAQFLNKDYTYDVTKVVNYLPKPVFADETNTDTYAKDLTTKETAYFSKFNTILKPLSSNFSGFKYSQIVLSDDVLINASMNAYANDSSLLANDFKIAKISEWINKQKNGKANETIRPILESAVANNHFFNIFNSLSNKWILFNKKQATAPFATSSTGFDSSVFQDYLGYLWLESLKENDPSSRIKILSYSTLVATIIYLSKPEGQKDLLENLRAKIPYGSSAYIVWEGNKNDYLNKDNTGSTTTAKDLLDASKLSLNNNNQYGSQYIGETTTATAITNNFTTSYSTNIGDYLKVVNKMSGYKGIQTAGNNSLSSTISDYLFGEKKNELTNNHQGILNGYSSLEQIITYIRSLGSFAQINEFISLMKSTFNWYDYSTFDENKSKLTLDALKEKVIKMITKIDSDLKGSQQEGIFKHTDGYVQKDGIGDGKKSPIPEKVPNVNLLYSAYVIQLNNQDLKDVSSLKKRITDGLHIWNETNKPANGAATTIDPNEVYFNLLVDVANNTNIQNKVLNIIASEYRSKWENDKNLANKAYDKRVNNQLGSQWLSNWKKES